MSDLQEPWHRMMLLKKKIGSYIELQERRDKVKGKTFYSKWTGKTKK